MLRLLLLRSNYVDVVTDHIAEATLLRAKCSADFLPRDFDNRL